MIGRNCAVDVVCFDFVDKRCGCGLVAAFLDAERNIAKGHSNPWV